MSRSSSSSTAAWSSTRWSRARRSAIHDATAASRCIRCSQGVFGMKGNIAALLNVEPKQVRVLTGNVGGSFGMKAAAYPEYVCMLHAARALGRPVKWTDERSGSFVSDSHGRDHDVDRRACARRRRALPRAAADQLRQHGRLPRQCRADAPDPERGEERAERLPHAADRGVDQVRVHQHHARLGLSRRRPARGQLLHGAADRHRRRRDGDRPAGAAPAQPDPAARDSVQGRVGQHLRQRRISRRAEARRSRPPTSRASASASARAASAASCAGSASAAFSKSPRRRRKEMGGIALRGRRQRDHPHRHARLRHGPRHAVRAGAERQARRAVREDPPAAGRQRRACSTGGGTGGSKSIMHTGTAHRRSLRQGDRAGQADRLARARSLRRRHRVHATAASSSPAPTARSASWSWPRSSAPASSCRRACRHRSTSSHVSDGPARPPIPTAATSARSRSIPTPA